MVRIFIELELALIEPIGEILKVSANLFKPSLTEQRKRRVIAYPKTLLYRK